MLTESIDVVARGQHGVISRAQALAAGLTARQIDQRVRSGRWLRIYRGVYRVEGARSTEHQVLSAALLAGGTHAVASHWSAGWLWGFLDDLELAITIPKGRSCGYWEIGVHRSELRRDEWCVRDGIPSTNPLRTILDLAGEGSDDLVDQVLDRAVATKLVPPAAIKAALDREARQGRLGVRTLRAALTRRGVVASQPPTVLEMALRRIVGRLGSVSADAEFEYRVLGGRYRLDCAWPALRLAVEVDGYEFHAGWVDFRQDRERQNALVLEGWTVLRFTWTEIRHQADLVARQILAAIERLSA